MVLCARLGYRLPGVKTIPEQISEYKDPYYDALEAAEIACEAGRIDVSEMEKLLESYLAKQLVVVQESATGKSYISPPSANVGKLDWLERRPVLYGLLGALLVALISAFLS